MCYIFIYVDHERDLNLYKIMISAGKYPVLGVFGPSLSVKMFICRFHGNEYKIGPNED